MLNEVSLFTGYAGMTLGLRLAGLLVRTVLYVEIDRKVRENIIIPRIRDGLLDDAPVWDDIRSLRGRELEGLVDIVTAGFPCQPHSAAGKHLGPEDPRNLWPDTIRIIREARPRWALLENSSRVLSRRGGQPAYGLDIIRDLAQAGYDAVWVVVSACDAGAPHLRERWFCLAWDADGGGRKGPDQGAELETMQAAEPYRAGGLAPPGLAHPHRLGQQGRGDGRGEVP